MSEKFLESFGGKLAEQWVAALLTPAFAFWAGGAVAWLQRFGWNTASTWFQQQPEPLQIALLIAGFCLIAASAFVVQRFDLPVLRFLESVLPNKQSAVNVSAIAGKPSPDAIAPNLLPNRAMNSFNLTGSNFTCRCPTS